MTERDPLSFVDQPRDESGRFAPKASEEAAPPPVEAKPETPVPAPEPAKAEQPPAPEPQRAVEPQAPAPVTRPEPVHVPIAGLLDEREKRQSLQRELDDLKRRYEDATRKQVELDPIGDQDGFVRHFDDKLHSARFEERANFSELMATEKHGAETVANAKQWLAEELKRNPGFWVSVENSPHPYDHVVKAHKRAAQMQTLGDKDLEAWAEEWARSRGLVAQAVAPVAGTPPPPTPTPLPRPSLASAPAASGSAPKTPVGEGVAFNAVFK